MFGKMAAEALGRADICKVLRPAEFAAAPSAAYLLAEDGERPFFVLQSAQDEYAFTDRALVHLDGTSAMSKKRQVRRYPWKAYRLSDVRTETAGTVDLDCEIKFSLAGRGDFSIDVEKKELPAVIQLYKALTVIAEAQADGAKAHERALLALERGAEAAGRHHGGSAGAEGGGVPAGAALTGATQAAFAWITEAALANNPASFALVFERFARY